MLSYQALLENKIHAAKSRNSTTVCKHNFWLYSNNAFVGLAQESSIFQVPGDGYDEKNIEVDTTDPLPIFTLDIAYKNWSLHLILCTNTQRSFWKLSQVRHVLLPKTYWGHLPNEKGHFSKIISVLTILHSWF